MMATMLVRRVDVLLRVLIERFLAAGRAEVIGLPLVLGFAGGRLWIDLHAADQVLHHVSLTSFRRMDQ